MANEIRTLVVEDESGVRFFLQEVLQQAGHHVSMAPSGEEALDRIREMRFDLVLLDLMLGGDVDGAQVLEQIKQRWPDTAVIILTAHASLDSTLNAIRNRVDAYLQKPAKPAEIRRVVCEVLDWRERLLQRRDTSEQEHHLQHDGLSLDMEQHRATLDGRPLKLTPREFKLLAHLMRRAPGVVSPRELVQAVHGYDCTDKREARQLIKWYIHRLRRKLEPVPSKPRFILNLRGTGYALGNRDVDLGSRPTRL